MPTLSDYSPHGRRHPNIFETAETCARCRFLRDARRAYVAVLEGEKNDRSKAGWYLGIAVENDPGYFQLKPGYGPYEDERVARNVAEELNLELGLSAKEAYAIVASTMAFQ